MDTSLVLIIEDEDDIAELYAYVLKQAGFTTEVIRDGKAALGRLAAVAPVLVILDMHLPQVSGSDILRRIRADQRLAGTRVIVTTGDGQAASALEQEADLVLVKPVSQHQLSDFALRLRPPK